MIVLLNDMKDIPVEILRLILAYLATDREQGKAGTPKSRNDSDLDREEARNRHLSACCLVNKSFLMEAQPLLYQSVRISSRVQTTRWLPNQLSSNSLARHIRSLRIHCLQAEPALMQILQASESLRWLTLEAENVERRDCLAECINTSLMKCTQLQAISLQGLTSIKTLSIVYNLPYRLTELSLCGLYSYKGALWDNSTDWINTESLKLSGWKASDKWDLYFLFQVCEISPARPPYKLTFERCQVSFDFLPDSIYQAVHEIRILDAPQLLQLDHLDRFSNTHYFTVSANHDFLKLATPLVNITHVTLEDCSEPMAKMFGRWFGKGYLPSLEVLDLPGSRTHLNGQPWLKELQLACSAYLPPR